MQLHLAEWRNVKPQTQIHAFIWSKFQRPQQTNVTLTSAFAACASFFLVFPTQFIRAYEKYKCVFKLDMLSE